MYVCELINQNTWVGAQARLVTIKESIRDKVAKTHKDLKVCEESTREEGREGRREGRED